MVRQVLFFICALSANFTVYGQTGDTVIVMDLMDLNTEGGSVSATYAKGHIKEAIVSLYGCSGQAKIIYEFSGDSIEVSEKSFTYNKPLSEVQSASDMTLERSLVYWIDINGKLLGKTNEERTDVFPELKTAVPFKL